MEIYLNFSGTEVGVFEESLVINMVAHLPMNSDVIENQ